MAVTTTEIVSTYAGNGSTTIPYPITILRDRDEDLKLLVDSVASTDFSISPDGFRTGVAYPNTSTLVLFRETPRTQVQPFPSNTTPAAEDVRASVDKLTLISQEVDEAIERTVKAPIGQPFPPLATLGFDDLGKPIARSAEQEVRHLGIGEKVEEAATSAQQAALAAQQAADASTALIPNAYYAPDTLEVYASPI